MQRSPSEAAAVRHVEKEERVEEQEVDDGRDEETCDGKVYVELVEPRGQDGVDRRRRGSDEEHATDEHGVRKEQAAESEEDQRREEEAQGDEVGGLFDVGKRARKVDETADGEERCPGADMHERLKRCAEHGRALDAEDVECESCDETEHGHLVRREKEFPKRQVDASPLFHTLRTEHRGEREADEHEEADLE